MNRGLYGWRKAARIGKHDAALLYGQVPFALLPVGTSSTTVAVGNDGRFIDARAPTGAAGGDLAGTYPNPTVVDATESIAGRRRSGRQMIRYSTIPSGRGTIIPASAVAYFQYMGFVEVATIIRFVKLFLNTNGGGSQTAEVGIFTSPLSPNGAAQVLTKVWADGAVDSVTSGAIKLVGNTAANTVPTAAGVHIWAASRFVMGTTQPTFINGTNDSGIVASMTSSPGALTGLTTTSPSALVIGATAYPQHQAWE